VDVLDERGQDNDGGSRLEGLGLEELDLADGEDGAREAAEVPRLARLVERGGLGEGRLAAHLLQDGLVEGEVGAHDAGEEAAAVGRGRGKDVRRRQTLGTAEAPFAPSTSHPAIYLSKTHSSRIS
jgi:hypothetical protein